MSKLVEVTCSVCAQPFQRPRNKYNEAVRAGRQQVCSQVCRNLGHKKGSSEPCLTCGKTIWVTAGMREASQTGRFYCSSSCAATNNNLGRVRSAESRERTKEAIRQTLIKKGIAPIENPRNCLVCGVSFIANRDSNKTCSPHCGFIHINGQAPATKEELITAITKMFLETGAAPSSKQPGIRRLSGAAKKYFGSWNAMMVSLGIKPNTQYMIRRRIKCTDGHFADSLSERIVDDWLHTQGIAHERHKPYPKHKRMTCDFYLPDYDLWVEYAGLAGEFANYDKTLENKQSIAQEHTLCLVLLKPEHLYPVTELSWLLKSTKKL